VGQPILAAAAFQAALLAGMAGLRPGGKAAAIKGEALG
jgi:hypothetical protein